MKIKWMILCVVLCVVNACVATTVKSPNEQIVLSFDLRDNAGVKDCPTYRVSFKGKLIVDESRLGFDLNNGSELSNSFEIVSTDTCSQDSIWKPIYGERSSIRDNYNQLTIKLSHKKTPLCTMEILFRCYDSGVALQYRIPKNPSHKRIGIKREKTEFRFLGDHVAWCVYSAQGVYSRKSISTMGSGIERPLTIEIDKSTYIAIAEAGLVDYARMKLGQSKERLHCVISELSSNVQAILPLTTPWRVIMIAENPGRLLENNDIILNLNEPNAIKNTCWIKPGKVIREVTLTTQGGKACVDFAAKHNMQYIEYDAGWYGDEHSEKSDAKTVTVDSKRSVGPLDLYEVIRYANERNIGIILYVNRCALERQLDDLLPLYEQWGIKGLKYGFVNVGSQKWTSWLHESVRKAARYELMVDIHDEYRPTGYSRTYPNLMTQEGIAGDETKPSNCQTLTILFTRMLSGPGDNTICYYDTRVEENASHAYQLAKAVCLYSPWQFLYWYDQPEESPQKKGGVGGQANIIGNEPELEFYDYVPTVWDDTKVIHGSIGEYAVMARRSGDDWFVGCMNSSEARTLKVPLDFLQPTKKYIAHIYSDDNKLDTRTHVRIERFIVTSQTVLTVSMTDKGGQAIRIVPATPVDSYPLYRN